MGKVSSVLAAAVGLSLGLIVWQSCPKEKIVRTPPEIVTRWDTVLQVDTQWVTGLRTVPETVNLIREVIVQVPETVFVADSSAIYELGITALSVPEVYGDTTRVRGFRSEWTNRSLVTAWWEVRVFTTGALRGIALEDSLPPRVLFWPYEEPEKSCGLFCKAKIVALAAPGVILAWEAATN